MFDQFSLPVLLISYVALLFSLSVHEASHATAAYLLNDSTARRLGRMTLNPIAHMDPVGTFLFPILGMSTGIPFIGWAKPVPVNPVNLTRKLRMKTAYALVAAAGPVSNLFLSLLFFVLSIILIRSGVETGISETRIFEKALQGYAGLASLGEMTDKKILLALCGQSILINLGLAIFNLIPFGPLDGASVLRAFIPDPWLPHYDRVQPFMQIVLLVLVFSGMFRFFLYPVFMFLIGILDVLQSLFLR